MKSSLRIFSMLMFISTGATAAKLDLHPIAPTVFFVLKQAGAPVRLAGGSAASEQSQIILIKNLACKKSSGQNYVPPQSPTFECTYDQASSAITGEHAELLYSSLSLLDVPEDCGMGKCYHELTELAVQRNLFYENIDYTGYCF